MSNSHRTFFLGIGLLKKYDEHFKITSCDSFKAVILLNT